MARMETDYNMDKDTKLTPECFSFECRKYFAFGFGFVLLRFDIGYKNSRHFLNIQKYNQHQSWLVHARFLAHGPGYAYLLRVMIGSCIVYVCCDRSEQLFWCYGTLSFLPFLIFTPFKDISRTTCHDTELQQTEQNKNIRKEKHEWRRAQCSNN